MKNYFETQRVNWRNFSPKNIIFKSNRLVKKLLPSENVLSWTSKSHRNQEMCKKTGCKATQTNQFGGQPYTYYTKENYKGVMVQLRDLKSGFVGGRNSGCYSMLIILLFFECSYLSMFFLCEFCWVPIVCVLAT